MKQTSFFGYYLQMFRNYAVFSGRTDRKEFWIAIAVHYALVTILSTISSMLSGYTAIITMDPDSSNPVAVIISTIITLYTLAVIIPLTALGVRRLHDVNRSGWWLLIALTGIGSIVLLIWMIREGTEDTNLFGSDPHPIRQYYNFRRKRKWKNCWNSNPLRH